MKRALPVCSALLLLALGCASNGKKAKDSNPYFATVTIVNGTPEWAHGEGPWGPLPVDARVYQGDQVRTDQKSSATLVFGKYGGVVRVPEYSAMALDYFGPSTNNPAETTVIVGMKAGHVRGDTLNLPPTTKFYINTAGGMFQLR
jgi:hypothetical protein